MFNLNELKKKNVKGLDLFLDKTFAGVCVFQKIFDEVELRYLAILPEFKRRGLGKKLFCEFLKRCKKWNINSIILEVSINNNEALSFYDYFGFETISIRKKYYKDGSDALVKQKKC